MQPTIRKMDAYAAARMFVADYGKNDRQWDMQTLDSYLPRDVTLRECAHYAGPATITDIAEFLRREAIYQ